MSRAGVGASAALALIVCAVASCGGDGAGGGPETADDRDSFLPQDTTVEDLGVETIDTALEVEVEVEAEVVEDVAPEVEVESEVVLPDALDATTYCEATVDLFCPYYLRCGRMAVADLAACRVAFLETCNARYEPVYAALAALGMLQLSRAGLAACEAHLAAVACEEQIFDLDGGCASVWLGQVAAGGACAPGIESFVCDGASTCRIDLDFCGTCTPIVAPGAACDYDHRCADDGDCIDGACVARVAVGGPCDDGDAASCVLGASCVSGTCRGPTIVALGDACDQARRCPYKSSCIAGRCAEMTLLGEACGAGGCASGTCEGGVCEPLGEAVVSACLER